MKKILAMSVCAIMLSGAFSCGNSPKKNSSDVEKNITEDQRTVINMAVLCNSNSLSDFVNKFNRENDTYYVEIEEYLPPIDAPDEPMLPELNYDIISGKIPDIVIAQPYDIHSLWNKGYLTDLYPLMEKYGGVQKENILPNIIEGLEIDGKLPALFSGYEIYTAAADISVYGEEFTNWTYNDAIAAYNDCTDELPFLNDTEKSAVGYYMLHNIGIDSIDFKNNTCDFGKYLPDVLEFLETVPDIITAPDNNTLICMKYLDGINHNTAYFYEQYNGKRCTFTGFPSVSENGADISIRNMCGVLEQSEQKKGAWEFISYILSDEMQTKVCLEKYNFPVTESASDILLYDTSEYTDKSIRESLTKYPEEMKYISDEEIEQLKEYFHSVKFQPYYDDRIDSIIYEEWLKNFNGEQTIDQCVYMLNNRIGLYLSENA